MGNAAIDWTQRGLNLIFEIINLQHIKRILKTVRWRKSYIINIAETEAKQIIIDKVIRRAKANDKRKKTKNK